MLLQKINVFILHTQKMLMRIIKKLKQDLILILVCLVILPPRGSGPGLRMHGPARSSTALAASRPRRRRRRRSRRQAATSARRIPGPAGRQADSSATQPPPCKPRGLQAESGRLLRVCQLSGPAARQAHHPVPEAHHPAAHDALAPIPSPTPNVRQHTLRATAEAASATESEGHGPGLCSPRRDERS